MAAGTFTTFANGVAALGTNVLLREGWKGAVVGKIREIGFVKISSDAMGGCG